MNRTISHAVLFAVLSMVTAVLVSPAEAKKKPCPDLGCLQVVCTDRLIGWEAVPMFGLYVDIRQGPCFPSCQEHGCIQGPESSVSSFSMRVSWDVIQVRGLITNRESAKVVKIIRANPNLAQAREAVAKFIATKYKYEVVGLTREEFAAWRTAEKEFAATHPCPNGGKKAAGR